MIRKSLIILMIPIIFSSCTGCSKSGRFKRKNDHSPRTEVTSNNMQFPGNNVIKMTKEDGVYKIPILINGLNMVFIFDTGAGLISISNTEASYLYRQGKLSKEDILGKAEFIDANGDISVGTIIKLKEVTIGDRTIYNINASVVDNSIAPLLLGQSALEKFGKVSIDYKRNEITFE
jgi:aspartyl protease family protein